MAWYDLILHFEFTWLKKTKKFTTYSISKTCKEIFKKSIFFLSYTILNYWQATECFNFPEYFWQILVHWTNDFSSPALKFKCVISGDNIEDWICQAIVACHEPKQASAGLIKKYIMEYHPKFSVENRPHLFKSALEKACNKGVIRYLWLFLHLITGIYC